MTVAAKQKATTSNFKLTEIGVLPQNWDVRTLGTLTTLLTNGFVGKVTDFYVNSDDGVLYIQGYNVQENGFNFHGVCRVSKEFHAAHQKSCLQAGDLLTIQTGDIGVTTIVPPALAGANCHALVISRLRKEESEPAYYCHYFNSHRGKAAFREIETGSTMKHVNVGDMLDMPLPYPPLPEQRAIAKVLDDTDELIGVLDKLILKKRDFKQAAIQQLLTGKKRLPQFSKEPAKYLHSDLGIIPEDWKIRTLKTCLRKAPDYGVNAPAVPYDDSLPTYIRITDIDDHGNFCPKPRVSVKHGAATGYYLREGDLVFARTGASVGKSYLYNPFDGPLVFAGFLIRVKPNPDLLVPAFLSYYLQTKQYVDWVNMMSVRSGQPGINGQEYGELQLPFPTREEQAAIAGVLSDMDTEITGLEQRRNKVRDIKQGMMQQLLTGKIRLV